MEKIEWIITHQQRMTNVKKAAIVLKILIGTNKLIFTPNDYKRILILRFDQYDDRTVKSGLEILEILELIELIEKTPEKKYKIKE
jgi:hypothetical protein